MHTPQRPANVTLGDVQVLVTGVSGYVGAALVPRLRADGHAVRGLARRPERVSVALDGLVAGDVATGSGLAEALAGVEVAYYLVHSMEAAAAGEGAGGFASLERAGAEAFGAAAAAAGVRRIVFLGGLAPAGDAPSRHLASRLAVEETLLAAAPETIALRASIVIGARSRAFRFLVRLVERLPVLALPSWRSNRTQPLDERDVIEFLARAATAPAALAGRSWDLGGPDVVTYGELVGAIADALLLARPRLALDFDLTPVAAAVAAAVAGEDPALIEPLMESLAHDLLPRDDDAARAFGGVRLHAFSASLEHALGEWEREEELAGR